MRQAALAGNLVWEHYQSDWSIDWDYNKNDKSNIFRPWGYQPGHLTEWAKLLLILERHSAHLAGSAAWLAPRAQALFDAALTRAWDHQHGGIHYGFGPDGAICDPDKYFWVQAESLAAAALLGHRTGEASYWDWYLRLWSYSWEHFVDHRHGAWFRILTADNRKISDEKSPAGKTGCCAAIQPHTGWSGYSSVNMHEANAIRMSIPLRAVVHRGARPPGRHGPLAGRGIRPSGPRRIAAASGLGPCPPGSGPTRPARALPRAMRPPRSSAPG